MKRLCVFCGSSPGNDPAYADAARALGRAIAEAGMGLVYGGGRVGLMGIVADAAMAAGAEAIGVIPQGLFDKEVGHKGLTELRVVDSMHTRKAMMADLSDGFVALPGGIGTLEELFEIWTWGQLGDHAKPFALLNVGGFYDPLAVFLDRLVETGFVKAEHRGMLVTGDEPTALIAAMRAYEPPALGKWIEKLER
ncbi:TIGR00730 family Rossman fold protein [Sphingomonas montanisoli]|uniref:Cytokinin riboside 5'-monophosphate phosphoribohydrolase n=1 Tax=Sphingomonas montanisoli TaxID=2606412 RepID=A0A5D9C709_9SPHN|nr:TIGR00730 family Rossman fold protein [Sphingomonas montanisoli]TZG27243.1 TIGR00730 family Rossman fold protein [Sphingomonas montanisoli]